MAKAGVYAYSTRGVWTVAILTDGDLYLTSNYKRKADYGFRLTKGANVNAKFPKYLYALVKEAWGLLDEAQVTLRDGE